MLDLIQHSIAARIPLVLHLLQPGNTQLALSTVKPTLRDKIAGIVDGVLHLAPL